MDSVHHTHTIYLLYITYIASCGIATEAVILLVNDTFRAYMYKYTYTNMGFPLEVVIKLRVFSLVRKRVTLFRLRPEILHAGRGTTLLLLWRNDSDKTLRIIFIIVVAIAITTTGNSLPSGSKLNDQ